ncbi:MAG: histidine phosphatase family protein [Cyanobacteria bacterium RI_101]|nr:histidine phosphatase family protein [Cyanobacteria bacterium RI_101]
MPQTLWLLRHGHRQDFADPDWFLSAPRRYDPPLSDLGLKQAQELAAYFQSETVDHLFCSPFLRTLQTAAPIAEGLGLKIKVEAGWGEWLNPDWMSEAPETISWEEILAEFPQVDLSYQSQVAPQYPETETDLQRRLETTWLALAEDLTAAWVVVGHSLTVTVLTRFLLGQDLPSAPAMGSATSLTYRKGVWRLRETPQEIG